MVHVAENDHEQSRSPNDSVWKILVEVYSSLFESLGSIRVILSLFLKFVDPLFEILTVLRVTRPEYGGH